MITTLVKKLLIPGSFIGLCIFLLVFFTHDTGNMTVITRQVSSWGIVYYKFDMGKYLVNLEKSVQGIDIWTNFFGAPPVQPKFEGIIKGIINYIIYFINWYSYIVEIILLGPIKLLMYPVNIIITLLGFNTEIGLGYYIKIIVQFHMTPISYW